MALRITISNIEKELMDIMTKASGMFQRRVTFLASWRLMVSGEAEFLSISEGSLSLPTSVCSVAQKVALGAPRTLQKF